MGTFSHISLLEFAVDVVAVRPVGGGEILADRNERGTRHVISIAEKKTLAYGFAGKRLGLFQNGT
jgi:hypothetical protein